MNAQGLFKNRRFLLAIFLMLILMLAIVTSEIATAGWLQPTTLVSDIVSVLCAVIAAALYVWAWTAMSEAEVAKKVWGLVALGIVLWTVAEVLWAYYELVLGIETPYPSIADVFWLGGYIPFYLALFLRYRSFQATTSARQRAFVWLFMILYSALLIFYVVKPILDTFDSSKLLENLTNIAYPLADWGLCLLTLVIIFSLEGGRFATVWRLFGAGLILTATADLLYFYAAWNELYYPEGQLTALSGLIDGLFNLSYLTMGLAIYAYVLIAKTLSTGGINLVLKSLTKMNVLVFVDPRGRVLSLSDNFTNLVHASSTKPYIGINLATALKIDDGQAGEMLRKSIDQGSLSNHPMIVMDTDGRQKQVWLTSFTIRDEQTRPSSIALVLRAAPPQGEEAEVPLKQDQKALVDYYLTKGGTSRADENQAIRTYFLEQMNLLYSLIEQFSGKKMADNLMEHLSQAARQNGWQISYSGQEITIPQEFEGQALADLLLALLQEAKNFAANMTDLRMVEQEMMSLDKNLGPETRRFIDRYSFHDALRSAV